ncbi:RNA polymerase sigma factor [Gynurincola endophyticus]|jgi:RNA polymerase sigma factor (sigma-70 family)|uniref:RNA polymerase sigma factor n=1 Tax=Gynurincola endophyticus TaxID=2479004 RepID=UPI000F8C7021|nr:sigma-70 family RNA polymerase sigma factor [Gynurincola endophyticus]
MSAISDQEILLEFQQGNKEQAFTHLMKKYQEKIYWHIRRIVVSHEDANDVIQNTFIKVWSHIDQFRADSKLYTWLYRIATNESLSFLEQRKKTSVVDFDDVKHDLSESITAEKEFDAQKAEWKLQLAIQQLPDKQRAVFNLRYYDEMTYEEISEVLNTSVGALKANYHHAAKKIEEFLLSN